MCFLEIEVSPKCFLPRHVLPYYILSNNFIYTLKEPEEFEFVQESPVGHADTRSIELVRLSDAGATDDSRFLADDSLDHDTSPSLVPHSQSMNPASSIAESSQSIIPPSEEPEHEKFDMVEVLSQTRKDGRIYRAVGTAVLLVTFSIFGCKPNNFKNFFVPWPFVFNYDCNTDAAF